MGVAAKGFYNITTDIKNRLLADINVNTVTFGDITRINLEKQDIYPISHLNIQQVETQENVLVFSVGIISMDIVDVNKEDTVDLFEGNDNEQDVLNTQLSVLVKLSQYLRLKSLRSDGYELIGNPILEPFTDRFGNEVAGWSLSMDITIANDIYVC